MDGLSAMDFTNIQDDHVTGFDQQNLGDQLSCQTSSYMGVRDGDIQVLTVQMSQIRTSEIEKMQKQSIVTDGKIRETTVSNDQPYSAHIRLERESSYSDYQFEGGDDVKSTNTGVKSSTPRCSVNGRDHIRAAKISYFNQIEDTPLRRNSGLLLPDVGEQYTTPKESV